ncbi:isoprenyl transferase [Clostridium sp. DL1XJH146]
MINLLTNKKKRSNIKLDNDLIIPKHIAIIMDGNGRWAQAKNMPRLAGHKAGAENVRQIVKTCNKLGVNYLTLYAFSTENWKRPQDEVNGLMNILVDYLKNEFKQLNENNVVIRSIGETSQLPFKCRNEIDKAYNNTKNNTGLVLNLALNYGGRNEIAEAFKSILKESQEKKIEIDDVTPELISKYLYTKYMPDPDLIIRTAGEQRISNFLLWQCAYSEFYYTNEKWPDFNEDELKKAILAFNKRDRRYGGLK